MKETFEGIIEIFVLTVYAVTAIFMIWLWFWFWLPDVYIQNTYEKVAQAMVKPMLPVKHYKVDTIPFGEQPTILPASKPETPFTEVPRMECVVPEKYWVKFIPCTKYGNYIRE